MSTGEEAGIYNNELQKESEKEVLEKFKAEGVTIVEPSEDVLNGFREKSKAFYTLPEFKDWTPGLYETVQNAMK